jgi:hypothetical protein
MQIQQMLFPLTGTLNAMETLLPKEGGLIQLYIGGHPPVPTGSKCCSGNLLFLAFVLFLNFPSHFEGINEVFF